MSATRTTRLGSPLLDTWLLANPPPNEASDVGPPTGVSGSSPTAYRPAWTQSVTVIFPLPSVDRGAQSARWNSAALVGKSSRAAYRPTSTQSVTVTALSPFG